MEKNKKFAIKIIFSTINPDLIICELAILKLLQNKEDII